MTDAISNVPRALHRRRGRQLPMSETVIVVPCYNEAARLPRHRFLDCRACGEGVHFLFVDDGSRDGTRELLNELRGEAPDRFSVLALEQNRGKAEAVRRGVLAARERGPAHIGFWDADLATPLDAIPHFVSRLREDPELLMVFGARVRLLGREIERRPLRHVVGRVFATFTSLGLSLPVYDTQCGAKLFRNGQALDPLFGKPFLSSWVFDVEILARLGSELEWDTERMRRMVYEVPLERWEDVVGSKLTLLDFPRALWHLVRILVRYRLGRS